LIKSLIAFTEKQKTLSCRFQNIMALSDRNEDRKERNRVTFQMVSDIGRAVVILAVAVVLLFGSLFKIEFVLQIDSLLRYGFGGISLMYGSFRLYRGIKQ